MTDTATKLPTFEGQPVVGSTLRITRAGDGLSDALELEPEALHYGEERVFILRGRVAQINHRPADPKKPESPDLLRQHTVVTDSILMVAPNDVQPLEQLLRDNDERIAHRRKELAGTPELDEAACPHCEAIFESMDELEEHVETKHDDEEGVT